MVHWSIEANVPLWILYLEGSGFAKLLGRTWRDDGAPPESSLTACANVTTHMLHSTCQHPGLEKLPGSGVQLHLQASTGGSDSLRGKRSSVRGIQGPKRGNSANFKVGAVGPKAQAS